MSNEPIIITTRRPLGDWSDLYVCVLSAQMYAPGHQLIIAWDGPTKPERCKDLHDDVLLVRRHQFMSSAEACWFLYDGGYLPSGDFLGTSDDCVYTPTTVPLLLADAAHLRQMDMNPGMLGCRSNFAPTSQNVRHPNGATHMEGVKFPSEDSILESPGLAPFCIWSTTDAFFRDSGGPWPHEMHSDDKMCNMMKRKGWRLFLSRAYVHHIGMRSSQVQGLTIDQLMAMGQNGVRS